jgi:hypothetical protein
VVSRPAPLALFCIAACWARAPAPASPAPAAALGRCPEGVDVARACGEWTDAVSGCEGADEHTSFPELDPDACFVPVRYDAAALPRADEVPAGCGYPATGSAGRLETEARRYDAIAGGATDALPLDLACELEPDVRQTAALANARTLRATARRTSHGRRFPYAAALTFGFGVPSHAFSDLVPWRPGDECTPLSKWQMDLFGINRVRAGRVAAAWHAGVAPAVVVSGGAVHGPLVEAFMLMHLAHCAFGVPMDAVLVDPCADHTHTNVRNGGGLVIALGGRTGYIVTDDGLQGQYLQEWTAFSLIGGSIDQRALRDWGYLLGSWRQASVGLESGFWFTPYRFWGDARLRDLQCVR